MNKYDSEIIAGLLESQGYQQAATLDNADAVIVNTCSVREHAEIRALGRIQVLAGWKKEAPARKLGVVGCMAQRMADTLLDACPGVDFVLGPDAYRRIPEILSNGKHGPAVATQLDAAENYEAILPQRDQGVSAWIAVMRGCNNFCSYCIVPYTRGRERSRPETEILEEFRRIAESGYGEVTLLGQNVNSYRDGDTDFAGLLEKVSREDRRIRVRFMTSHPKDLSDALIDVIASEPNVCPHVHLPVQSGSDSVLALMNRNYTREKYLALVRKMRTQIPDVAITTDVLVGFPGETEAYFQETITLMKTVRFDDAFMYHYSVRQGTRAAEMQETLTQAEKLRRLDKIIQLQRQISLEIKQAMIGRIVEVLPEGRSRKNKSEWLGKTPANHSVVFSGADIQTGRTANVILERCKGATLWGRQVSQNRL